MSRVRFPLGPRVSGWLAVAAVTVLALTALTQCRMMPESITGMDVHRGGLSAQSDCIRACNETYQAAVRAEAVRYHEAMLACGDDTECRRAQAAIHADNMQALVQQMRDCKDACYNEGSGSGGQ